VLRRKWPASVKLNGDSSRRHALRLLSPYTLPKWISRQQCAVLAGAYIHILLPAPLLCRFPDKKSLFTFSLPRLSALFEANIDHHRIHAIFAPEFHLRIEPSESPATII
jgi:hypothetical protein